MVNVTVDAGFPGEVLLETGCRDEDFRIQPGETETVARQVDAETCGIALYVDDREAYNDTIHDYESTTLRINSRGEVDDETVEL